jgi:hypothetical protein
MNHQKEGITIMYKNTVKKNLFLIGTTACMLLVLGIGGVMPFVLADTGLPVDVGESLAFRIYEGNDEHHYNQIVHSL